MTRWSGQRGLWQNAPWQLSGVSRSVGSPDGDSPTHRTPSPHHVCSHSAQRPLVSWVLFFFFSLVNIREIFLILKRPTAILKSESTAWVNHLLGHEDCHQRTGTAEGFQFRWHERFQLALVWIIELTWLDHLFDGLIELCVFLKALLCAADEFCLCTETSRWGCWYRQCWNLSVCFL